MGVVIVKTKRAVYLQRIGEHLLATPAQQTEHSAGFDLSSAESCVIKSGKRKMIPTGFAWQIPQDYVGQVWPRSGLAFKFGVDVLAGVIDSDFRGEVKVILINHGEQDFIVTVGDRIAQMLLVPVLITGFDCEVYAIQKLQETFRGTGELGSTGTN